MDDFVSTLVYLIFLLVTFISSLTVGIVGCCLNVDTLKIVGGALFTISTGALILHLIKSGAGD